MMPSRRDMLAAGLIGAGAGLAVRPAEALPRTGRATRAIGTNDCRIHIPY